MRIHFKEFNEKDDSRSVVVFNDDNSLALCVRIYHEENFDQFDYFLKNIVEFMMDENFSVDVSDTAKFTTIHMYKNGDKILYVAMSKYDKEAVNLGLKLLK